LLLVIHISRGIFIILLLFFEEVSIPGDNLRTLHQELIHLRLMRWQMRTALRPLLQVYLLDAVMRLTQHHLLMVVMVAVAATTTTLIRQCHGHPLNF